MARLFRKDFLVNLQNELSNSEVSVPERHLPLFWPTLVVVGFSVTALCAWLLLVKIPVTVSAQGIAVPLGGVRELSALGNGAVEVQRAQAEQSVKAGDLLITASSPFASLEYQDMRATYLKEEALNREERRTLERQAAVKEQEAQSRLVAHQENVARTRESRDLIKVAISKYEAVKESALEEQRAAIEQIDSLWEEIERDALNLEESGVVSRRNYIQLRQDRNLIASQVLDLASSISETEIEQQRFRLEVSELENTLAQEEILIQELHGDLEKLQDDLSLEIQSLELKQVQRGNELLDAERKLWLSENVLSPYDGHLVALQGSPGQTYQTGESLGLISLVPQSQKLMLVISPEAVTGYFDLRYKDKEEIRVSFGKDRQQIHAGLVSALESLLPTATFSINQIGERYIIEPFNEVAKTFLEHLVIDKASLHDPDGVPVFAMLNRIGEDWDEKELSFVAMLQPEDGKLVQRGSVAKIKPEFEKAIIGAQIFGEVSFVSDFVLTSIEGGALIGSVEVARTLQSRQQEPGIAVVLKFSRDEDRQLILDGDQQLSRDLSIGALGEANIHIEYATPLEILLPFYIDIIR